MRDFLPADIRKRNYVIGIIKDVYESYGFEPLETPAVENLSTLTGKYGEEGNQLIYKILKRGEKLANSLEPGVPSQEQDNSSSKLQTPDSRLADLALRYDLTVPLARVVANNRNELPKFFKRYQIQPVWRADRPARGRYREFYQCDVDAIGSSSMIVEAELISAVSEILKRLGFEDFEIRINHRKFLSRILESAGVEEEKCNDALVALDKLDKIGTDNVITELVDRGIQEVVATNLIDLFRYEAQSIHTTQAVVKTYVGSQGRKLESFSRDLRNDLILKTHNDEVLSKFSEVFTQKQIPSDGLDELKYLLNLTFREIGHSGNLPIRIDPSLARGLSYYTGAIFEIVLTEGDFKGSIGGGGRYDGLIGMFGKEQIPACGFSLGLERILVVMDERGMFPPEIAESAAADVMVAINDEDTITDSLKFAAKLRETGLRVLVYPEADKLGKQYKYADSINIPFVCELAEGKVTLKNMKTGEKVQVDRDAVAVTILGAIGK